MYFSNLLEPHAFFSGSGIQCLSHDNPALANKPSLALSTRRLNTMRQMANLDHEQLPGPEGSLLKLQWSELNQRLVELAFELEGPYSSLAPDSADAPVEGRWQYEYLRARGNTIEAGTSEVQRNIVAERVLGLPRQGA